MQNTKPILKRALGALGILAISAAAITGCSAPAPKAVAVASHDSFVIPDNLINQFKTETGFYLEGGAKLGDAGTLTNKLVLTKGSPVADVVFGIDNTFAGVATSNGIIDGDLVPIDYADVCFNYDRQWFATKGITPPASWRQLTEPQYKGLTVLENPATSSTGLAFLFSTIAALGEQGWPSWWAQLKANDVKVAAGWEDAYYIDFSGSSGHGQYPIVLSYSSSPADEIDDDGLSRTVSLNNECFRQIEYAGVLKNAKNPEGARAFIKFMQSNDFQSALPEANYVYPIVKGIKLPDAWARFAKPADSFVDVSNLDFDANRRIWQKKWAEIMAG